MPLVVSAHEYRPAAETMIMICAISCADVSVIFHSSGQPISL